MVSRTLSLALYAGVLAVLYTLFDAVVTEPYMDEPFHVGQTQAYCAGNWSSWDGKITTFPGLYACVAASVRLSEQLAPPSGEPVCTLSLLRVANLLPAFVTPLLLQALIGALHPKTSDADAFANALVLSLLPTHFFFHFLYYTDSAATTVRSTARAARVDDTRSHKCHHPS